MNTLGKPKPEKEAKTKKRKKVSERKQLEKKLDLLCREIVLDRDVHCVCPPPSNGHSSVLQCGHLITRSKESVRWDLRNLNAQCSGCNLLHEYNPHRYTMWFIHKFGLCVYEHLFVDADKITKLQVYELQELYDQMKKIREKQLISALSGEPFKPYFTQKEILSGAWLK